MRLKASELRPIDSDRSFLRTVAPTCVAKLLRFQAPGRGAGSLHLFRKLRRQSRPREDLTTDWAAQPGHQDHSLFEGSLFEGFLCKVPPNTPNREDPEKATPPFPPPLPLLPPPKKEKTLGAALAHGSLGLFGSLRHNLSQQLPSPPPPIDGGR